MKARLFYTEFSLSSAASSSQLIAGRASNVGMQVAEQDAAMSDVTSDSGVSSIDRESLLPKMWSYF